MMIHVEGKTNSQIKFKNSQLKLRLCDSIHAHIHVKGTITRNYNTGTAAAPNNKMKKLIFENCASFIDCISEINNAQVDNAKDVDLVMPMYNLI